MDDTFEIFLAVAPGLEPSLLEEVSEKGWTGEVQPGGIVMQGGWRDVWRANLELRGATRVLARLGGFRVMHLAQLDKRARKFDWSVLRADVPLKVEVTCRKSRIYHAGAARQRIAGALEAAGFALSDEAALVLRARIDDDFCTFSVDTSGEPLHKRGHKVAVGKAPLRETLAAHFLRLCRYAPGEPLVDPMCGSGTFPIEACEISMGLHPGRDRSFAFEQLGSFDSEAWSHMKTGSGPAVPVDTFGFDRDQGAVASARKNAARAQVTATFDCAPISALTPPVAAPGLVMVNPPYGARIGNKRPLHALYASLGTQLKAHFSGWRFGIVTSDKGLARTTSLEFQDVSPPIPHGGLKVFLFQGQIP